MTGRRDFSKRDGPIRSVVCFLAWLLVLAIIGAAAVSGLIKRRFIEITAGRKAGA